jgi:hypothetical protein
MKKLSIFLFFLIPALLVYILLPFFTASLNQFVINFITLLGSIFGFIAWAYLFWTLGSFFQILKGNVESEFPELIIENLKLFIDDLGFDIHGKILSSNEFNEKTPLVFLLTGGGGQHMKRIGMGSALVKFGVKVVVFDHPGVIGKSHGTTPESKIRSATRSILTLKKILNSILSREDFKPDKIGLIGNSLGAFTVVYGGFSDNRINIIIGQSAGLIEDKEDLEKIKKQWPWWFKKFCQIIKLDLNDLKNMDYKQFTNPKFAHLRNRIYLLQTKDDKMVHYNSFLKLKGTLQLPDENCLVFEKGGHDFLHHECTIMGWIMRKLKEHLFTD